MGRLDQLASERFLNWEQRTRGWQVYPHPVSPEPPFARFPGPRPAVPVVGDDGKRSTVLSGLWQGLWQRPAAPPVPEPDEPEEVAAMERGQVVELPLYLPDGFNAKGAEFGAWAHSLVGCREPLAFELVGTAAHVTAQLAVGEGDGAQVRGQLRAFFPDLVTTPQAGGLQRAWAAAGDAAMVVEFGLSTESVLPLAAANHDLQVGLVGALAELAEGECAVFQVTWQSVEEDWATELMRAVTDAGGGNRFVNAPELAGSAKSKVARPLYAAVVRLAARSADDERTIEILRSLAGALRPLGHPQGNELIPLRNDDYPYEAHLEDLLRRQCRRPGMILGAEEFLSLVHLPTAAVRSAKFRRMVRRTKAAPAIATGQKGRLLGRNEHGGEGREVRLSAEQRRMHMHIVGASGTGKTTLLYNLIRQDIEAGEGVAVLDPHGDLVDRILGIIPPERIGDVVLLDPGDEEYSIGFNILSAHSDLEKNLLASDLVAVFQRLSTSWGDQMGIVLGNAIRAFLESEQGGTLADLRRFLLEPKYREQFLRTVKDPDVVYYWQKGFAQLTGNKSIGPVMTRLETFLSPKPIRYMVSQPRNRLDFGEIMDGRKIFLAKLSHGAIGKENSHLLGSLLMTKFHQMAMGRQRMAETSRRDFWLYVDEFQNFVTESMAGILTEARKYRLGLTLAHQELRQLQRDPEVAGAVLSNPYTRVCFRVGDADARTLEHGLSGFAARDLQNLGRGEAVCRVERSDYSFNLDVLAPELPSEEEAAARRKVVVQISRTTYATPRADVEAALRVPVEPEPPEPSAPEPVRPVQKPAAPAAAEPPPVPEPVALAPMVVPVEAEPAAVTSPPAVEITAPKLAGKGGNQHKQIQDRLEAAALELGFRPVIEKGILGNSASVDLALSRGDMAIACEIAVTNTIDYEVGNVAKCLRAGYLSVAVVGVDGAHLGKLRPAVANSLGPEAAAQVAYFLPDEFIEHLRGLPTEPLPESVTEVRGYRVKRKFPQLSPEERNRRENEAIKAIAEMMRRKQ